MRTIIFLLCLLALSASCAHTPPAQLREMELEARFIKWLEGDFHNDKELVDAERMAQEEHFPIAVHMRRIPQIPNAVYVEQAGKDRQDKPYRQRVYLIDALDAETISVTVCELARPQDFVNAHLAPEKLAAISPALYAPMKGCNLTMKWDGEKFAGSTADRECANDFRGATWATSEVTLRADGFSSFDRGWNDAGEQVWGAEKFGYEFEKVMP